MRRCSMVVGMLLAFWFVVSADAQNAPTAVGWRQNWTGLFPEATPQTEWGRTLKDSMVKGLRVQAKRPRGFVDDAAAVPMADGALSQCLVLGPFNPNDAAKALDETFFPNEAEVLADEGGKVGESEWKFLKQDGPNYPHSDYAPLPIHRLLGKPKAGQVAYAHAYLHSAKAGKVVLMLDHTGGCKFWLNGKLVNENPKASLGFGWWHWLSRDKLYVHPWSRSQRFELQLNQGWNRLLFKVSGMDMEWGNGWAFLARFTDLMPPKYDDKNILWAAPLASTSNSNPVIVGNKIFVVSEQDELVCLDKKTGKPLWHAFNNYYEATPKAERDANPVFKEIEPLAAQLDKEPDFEKRRDILRQMKDLLTKSDAAKYGMVLEDHPASHYYATGFTTPTPCSDGKFIYAWFTEGVAACYDLDGNRRWIKRIDELVKDPKAPYGPYFYPEGCVLAGGKFILWDKDVFALDAATGAISWRIPDAHLGFGPVPAVLGGQEAVIGLTGALRVSDGKLLWQAPRIVMPFGFGGVTFVDHRLLFPSGGGVGLHVFDFAEAKGEDLKPAAFSGGASAPEENKQEGSDYYKKGEWKDIFILSAPLCHDGLVYMVNCDGMLYVMEAARARLVYRQKLPLKSLVAVRSVGLCAPVTLGGKHIYVFDNVGNCVVFEPGREYKQVALNHIETFIDRTHTGDGWQEFGPYGAPVFEGGRIYVRMESHLYCIGKN